MPQAKSPANSNKPYSGLIDLDWNEWSTKVVPPREHIMGPIIQQKSLNEIYGPRGTGKTYLTLGIAVGAATGTDFLRWTTKRPFRVLYVDGEMDFVDLQARTNKLIAGLPTPQPGFLRLIAADLQERGIPDLGAEDPAGRAMINEHLRFGTSEQVELMFLDNLSALTGTPENSDEGWHKIQGWLLYLKRKGVAVIFVHHAGKTGIQRGTSKKEDLLDTVIALKKPKNWKAGDPASPEIHFEKNRGFYGADALPFQGFLGEDGKWGMKSLSKESQAREAISLRVKGMSIRKIATYLNIPKTNVENLLKIQGLNVPEDAED
ncbi:AAA family ATPase [Phyllobacterium sp. LjRoot231]|uniref:AAA family ATPase n=1 Tax=Phyllobacterium sp. LjRoot231 TaxID=3342289 RepID=UPI003ECD0585